MDGSWSIGRLNFKTIRNFIARTVSVFDIGPNRVQIGKFLQVDQLSNPEWNQAQIFVSSGLAQYSGDPKTEWHLNAHPTKESLLNAISNLPYKGGNTMTGEDRAGPTASSPLVPITLVALCSSGMALNYILQNNFKINMGMRPEARKIGVLITDGKSQDDVVFNSQNLRDNDIELYAIGERLPPRPCCWGTFSKPARTISSLDMDIHLSFRHKER